jgi:hypothetical protein
MIGVSYKYNCCRIIATEKATSGALEFIQNIAAMLIKFVDNQLLKLTLIVFQYFKYCCIVDLWRKLHATKIFESLASGIRLDLFRLLVKHAPTGLVAGEIAVLLDLPPNNLSFHLKAMTHAGLINVTQEGRY